MIGHRVQFSCTLAGTCRSTSVLKVIQTISPFAYSSEANYEGTLEFDDLCKQAFFCHLNNISIGNMLSIQPKVYVPKWNSLLKLCLASY